MISKNNLIPILLTFTLLFWGSAGTSRAQGKAAPVPPPAEQKTRPSLQEFKGLVPGVDLFSSRRESLTPFIKPLTEGLKTLRELIGEELPKGAFIICNTAAEKDSVSDERYLRRGYKWVITELTPEATRQQMIERIKARISAQGGPGASIPPEFLARFTNPDPKETERILARMASTVVRKASYAAVSTLLQPEKLYRNSRVEDVSRSPLDDWLDIGIAGHISKSWDSAIPWVKQRAEELYSLEDLFQMNQPFVVASSGSGSGSRSGNGSGARGNGSSGGGAVVVMGGSATAGAGVSPMAAPSGASGGSGGTRTFSMGAPGSGPGGRQMSQETIDRMNFDNQSTLVFHYCMEKLGQDKVKTLIKMSREKQDIRAALEKPDFFGKSLLVVEKDWMEWVKTQKGPEGPGMRMMMP